MPCPNDKNRYQKFYVQQNQLSVYSETAASKRREECAKQQRIELDEKFKNNQHILRQFRFGKSIAGEDDIVKKKKTKKSKRNFFKADEISENDERDRLCVSIMQYNLLGSKLFSHFVLHSSLIECGATRLYCQKLWTTSSGKSYNS